MKFTWIAVLVAAVCLVHTAWGGAAIEIDEDSNINLGFRVQSLAIVTDKDTDGDGQFESDTDFKVRRGRLRLAANVTEWVSAFMQTDIGSGVGGAGLDWRLIDAWIELKPTGTLSVYAGQHMAPASRENLTSSGAMMTMDRPGMNYKTLTWGTRSVTAFANNTLGDADAGLRGDVDVRDTGITLFGRKSLSDSLHVKCYLGGYDGIQQTAADEPRLSGRIQVNCFDAEPGYFNSATYLGKKKTVGIGASFDSQSQVAASEDQGDVDYQFYTVDAFAELPVGPGSLTVEGAVESLDLDDATALDHDGDPETAPRDATRAQGDGFYVQAGYLVDKWQPWVEFEQWNSDAADDTGSYDLYRVGMSYFIKGHNANLKAGFERAKAESTFSGTDEDTIDSFVVGCYVTY